MIIKQDARTIVEFPMTVGVIGAVFAPMLAAAGALAAVLTECTIEVERQEDDKEKKAPLAFVIRLLVNAAALWVATRLVPGVTYSGEWLPFLGVALVFGIVNAWIRPVAKLLTFPLILLSLGLFLFVINGLMLWVTSRLSVALGLGFHVAGFWPAFWGALVVTLTSAVLSTFVTEERA